MLPLVTLEASLGDRETGTGDPSSLFGSVIDDVTENNAVAPRCSCSSVVRDERLSQASVSLALSSENLSTRQPDLQG